MDMLLHLKGLPPQINLSGIRDLFRGYDIPAGGILIPKDGYAFVEFANSQDLLDSLSMDGTEIHGHKVTFLLSTEEERTDFLESQDRELGYSQSQMGAGNVYSNTDTTLICPTATLSSDTNFYQPATSSSVYTQQQPFKRQCFYLEVRNIDPSVTEQDVRTFFGSIGESITPGGIVAARGHASAVLVEFNNEEDFKIARMMNGRKLRGCPVSLSDAHASEFTSSAQVTGTYPESRSQATSALYGSGRGYNQFALQSSRGTDNIGSKSYGTYELGGPSRGTDNIGTNSYGTFEQAGPFGTRHGPASSPGFSGAQYLDRDYVLKDYGPGRSKPAADVSTSRFGGKSATISIDYGHKSGKENPQTDRNHQVFNDYVNANTQPQNVNPDRNDVRNIPPGYYVKLDQMPSWANISWVKWFLGENQLKEIRIFFVCYQSKALYSFVQFDSEGDAYRACAKNRTIIGSDTLSVEAIHTEAVRSQLQNLPPHLSVNCSVNPPNIATRVNMYGPKQQRPRGFQEHQKRRMEMKQGVPKRPAYETEPSPRQGIVPLMEGVPKKVSLKKHPKSAKQPKLPHTQQQGNNKPQSVSASPSRNDSKQTPTHQPQNPPIATQKTYSDEPKKANIRAPLERWPDHGDLYPTLAEEILQIEGLPLGPKLTPDDVKNWLTEAPRKYRVIGHYNVFRTMSDVGNEWVNVVEFKVLIPKEQALPVHAFVRGYSAKITHASQFRACGACRKFGHTQKAIDECPAFNQNKACLFLKHSPDHGLSLNNMACSIYFKKRKHKSIEHAYLWAQALWLKRHDLAQKVIDTTDLEVIKDIWLQLPYYHSLNWEKENYLVLKELVLSKYEKSGSFRNILQHTGNQTIFYLHAYPTRGVGYTAIEKICNVHPDYYTGLNLYGRALMSVREERRSKPDLPDKVFVVEEDEKEDSDKEDELTVSETLMDVYSKADELPDHQEAVPETIRFEGLPIGPKLSVESIADWLMSDPLNLEIIDGPHCTTKKYKGEFDIFVVSVTVQGPVMNPALPERGLVCGYTAKIKHPMQKKTRYCRFCLCSTHKTGDILCKAYKETKGKVHYFKSNKDDELSPNCASSPITFEGVEHSMVAQAYVLKESDELTKQGIECEISYSSGTWTKKEPMLKASKYKLMEWEAESLELWKDLYRCKWESSPAFRQALADTRDMEIVFIDVRLERGCGIYMSISTAQTVDPAWLPGLNLVGKALMAIREEKASDPLTPVPSTPIPTMADTESKEKSVKQPQNEANLSDSSVKQPQNEGNLAIPSSNIKGNIPETNSGETKGKVPKQPSVVGCTDTIKLLKGELINKEELVSEARTQVASASKTPILKSPDTFELPQFKELVVDDSVEIVEVEGLPLSPELHPDTAISWLKLAPRNIVFVGHYNVFKRAPSKISDYEVYVIQALVKKPIDPVMRKHAVIGGYVCKISHASQQDAGVCIICRQHGHVRQDTDRCPAYTEHSQLHFVENLIEDELSPLSRATPLEYEGFEHLSVNNAFLWKQAVDLGRPEIAEKLKVTIRGADVGKLWNQLHFYDCLNWELNNYQLIKELYQVKWQKSASFRTALRCTGNKQIQYIHIRITRGIGITGLNRVLKVKAEYFPGLNMVGHALMEVRQESRSVGIRPVNPIPEPSIPTENEETDTSDKKDENIDIVDMDIDSD